MGYDLSESETRALLEQACSADGVSAEGARLLRLGSNAVYQLHSAPVVARIARPDADIASAYRTVAVARWLESAGYPAVRAIDVEQPLVIGGHAITFWEALRADEYATIAEVADVLARLHALAAPASLNLPQLEPFADADKRIADSGWLTPGERDYMSRELDRLRGEYAQLKFTLPRGVIHGDANIGNVLHDLNGNPAVIDLDDFCTGPREWDLIQTAMYADRYGWHTAEQYETFTRVYGYDITQWDGYQALSDIREFLLVTWMAQKAGESEQTAAEARKRIDAIRTGASRKDWLPFLVRKAACPSAPQFATSASLRPVPGNPRWPGNCRRAGCA
jgi:Ser/Thr protein kinase RdoA (MazF antagonist)